MERMAFVGSSGLHEFDCMTKMDHAPFEITCKAPLTLTVNISQM